MRNSLRNLVVAACLVAFPITASALDVRMDATEEQPVKRYEGDRVSFEYGDGMIVSRQTMNGVVGEVEQVTVQFVDPVSGIQTRDAFLSVSIYDRPPVVPGSTGAEDAIAKNLLAAIERGMGEGFSAQDAPLTVPYFGDVDGYSMMLGAPEHERQAIFFVKKVETGFAVVFVQHGPNDEKIAEAINALFQTISFGAN